MKSKILLVTLLAFSFCFIAGCGRNKPYKPNDPLGNERTCHEIESTTDFNRECTSEKGFTRETTKEGAKILQEGFN